MSVMGWISKGIEFQTEGWSGYIGIPYKNVGLDHCVFSIWLGICEIFEKMRQQPVKMWWTQWEISNLGLFFSTQMVHNLVDNEIHDQVQNMQCGQNTKHSSFVEKAESVSINMSQWLFRALIVRIPNCSQNNSKTAPNNHGDVRKNNSRLEFAVAWQTQKQRYDLGTLWHQLPAIMMGYIFHGPCNRTDCSYDLAGMNNWAFGWFLGFLCFFSHNPNAMETHQVFALLIILVGSTAQPVLPSPNWGQKTMA